MKTLTLLSFVLLLVQSYLAVEYVVTTEQFSNYNNGHGYIAFPATTYGQGQTLTFVFDFAYQGGNNACVLGMGKDEDYFDVIVRGNRLVIRDLDFESTSTKALAQKQYYNLIIQFKNHETGSRMKVYMDGKDISSTFDRLEFRKFSNEQRKESFAGLCKLRKGSKHTTNIIYFDEFHIYDRQLLTHEIQILADPKSRKPISDQALVVHYPFDEGVGHLARGITGTYARESYAAKLTNLARFTTRNVQGMLKCHSTGDPHVTDFFNGYFTPTHRKDWSRLVSCKSDTKDKFFTINSFHDFGHPSHPKATLNRELTVKYGDTVIKISLSLDIKLKKKRDTYTNYGKYTGQIGDLYFKYNNEKTVLYVYGSPFALLQVNKKGSTHLDVYVTASASLCTGKSYCQGNRDFIQEIEYEGDDDDVDVPPPLPDPPQSEPYNPCSEDDELDELANTVCKGKWREGTPQFEACKFDVCATGDPTVPDVDEECIAERRRLIEEGEEEKANLLPCIDNPCNCIFGTCDPETRECTCVDGFVGKDCSQESHLLNLTLTHDKLFNEGYPIQLVADYINVNTPSILHDSPQNINEWAVENSFLVYVASVRDHTAEGKFKYSLFLVGDLRKSSSDSTTINFKLEGSVDGSSMVLLDPSKGSIDLGGNKANIGFVPYDRNGLFIGELGADWCVEFDLSDSKFEQVVVGSGNKLNKLDVIKVPTASRNAVKVCGKILENPCASFDNCKDCMQRESCGWCRSSERCLLGNPAGPVEGSSCPKWAFTYDEEVSRRVNAEFGVPVNPRKQDVFLVSGSQVLSTLPVEITVDMGHSKGSVFDVAIVSPKGSLELDLFRTHINDYLSSFNSYPDVGIAFATYDSSKFNVEQTVGALDLSGPYLSQVLNNLVPTNSNGDVTNALRLISTTKHPNWRSNTRHVVIVLVGDKDLIPSTPAPKSELLEKSIFPVFIVRGDKTKYQAYIDDLGFGAAISIDASGSQLKGALSDAVEIASKAVSLVPVDMGHLVDGEYDQTIWNIHGLDIDMRGRMQFPMKKKSDNVEVTRLVAPGFGHATIENLLTDKPIPKTGDIDMIQEQPLAENNNLQGEIIELTGQSLDPNDPVQFEITGFGDPYKPELGIGRFYQLPDDISDTSKYTQREDLDEYEIDLTGGSVFVNDVTGRIIYLPPLPADEAYSVSALGKFPFTSIKYRVHDSCIASDEAEVKIFIAYENKPPKNHFIPHTGKENQALLIDLGGVDYRTHELCAVVDKLPYELKDGVEKDVGELYEYNEAIYNQLSSVEDIYRDLDLPTILSGLTEVEVGARICSNKVIFIPGRYENSEYKPASGQYQIDPHFAYHVVQKERNDNDPEGAEMLASVSGEYAFNVEWVNQAPFVQDGTFVAPEDSCTYHSTCEFDQNLGVYLPNLPTPVLLSAIAGDIEEEPVDIHIDSVQCHNALVESSEGDTITNGFVIQGVEVFQWYNFIRFRPHNKESGDDYCVIEYHAVDSEGASSDTATITIDINFVNQPPFSMDRNVNAYELGEQEFEVYVADIDTPVISGQIIGCEKHVENTFIFTLNGVTFSSEDCDTIGDGVSIGTISGNSAGEGVYIGKVACGTDCPTENGPAITLFVDYDDGETREGYTPVSYSINVQYLRLNKPGLFWEDGKETNKSREFENAVPDIIPIQDIFFPCGDLNIRLEDDSDDFTVTLELDIIDKNNEGAFVFFDPIDWQYPTHAIQFSANQSYVRIRSTVASMNNYLQLIKVCAFDAATFRVHYRYDDGGYYGYCPLGFLDQCREKSNAYTGYRSADTNNVPATIGAVAAGAVVLGAAAAVGAWMKFKKLRAPEEGSDPWLLDDQNEGVVDNPMYEQRGGEAENPLYEANLDEE